MDENEVMINNIRDMFIEMNKGTVSDDNSNMYCDKRKQTFNEMNHAYRCMRTLIITDDLFSKTNDHVYKTMLLWRKLKIPVTS